MHFKHPRDNNNMRLALSPQETKTQLRLVQGETKLAGAKLDAKVSAVDWKLACAEINTLKSELKNASQRIKELERAQSVANR